MSVHTAITAHSKKQHDHIEAFLQLDQLREQAIDQALQQCIKKESFSITEINQISRQINEHALKGISPVRKLVTEQMIQDYADRTKQQ
ncbi:DUF2533 family protein [Paenibacillus psychroresistens]|uniref:DUF2533 family protein n=1 Tax=Paenibacillus psychroresistens TaxID=1778678 RepID=A0A6B8RL21_9BACL|nr:DUF2533 family protein [Paenibacillus psychroresistens]QGQ96312.1 DUF2533 family protein [Paenibacillus psychroresistens]